MQRKWPAWLILFVVGMPLAIAGYVIWATYYAPLPTKPAGEMVSDMLGGAAPFSEALSTAGREGGAARVYIRFRTAETGVDKIASDFELIASELTPAGIGAIRADARMPEWWRPHEELAAPALRWAGARDGWNYDLYFNPATGATYFIWTLQ